MGDAKKLNGADPNGADPNGYRPHSAHSSRSRASGRPQEETPLPKGQLAILAVIALAEQTALNSISPYLPDMVTAFPEVKDGQVGMSVGALASAFALAQFMTNFAWGLLSDRVGRKPVVLTGTLLTAVCFVAFGFCRTLWQAIVVQALMGLVNGNQGVISTCLGEITDRSNQSRAFTYLPVIYGLGGITGPIVGGLLVLQHDPFHPNRPNPYPYLAPNLFSAAVLIVDLILTALFLKESLQTAQDLPPLGKRIGNLFSWLWQFTSSHRPTYLRRRTARDLHLRHGSHDSNEHSALLHHHRHHHHYAHNDDHSRTDDGGSGGDHSEGTSDSMPSLIPGNDDLDRLSKREVLNRDTVLLLLTFLIFQLSNISYNSLYPIFAQAPPPTGRDLHPSEIGLSLAFSGVVTILFQVGVFGWLREKMGNRATYRTSLAFFVLAFLLMPWVGYKDGTTKGTGKETMQGKAWLWAELGAVLFIKTVAAVSGLTSALLLITNSAPSHAVLGTLNGLAQTLSAAGRGVGPFISGSLFSAATKVQPRGEALAFGIFGGIIFLGFLLSFGIHGANLEQEGWEESSGDEEEATDSEHDGSSQEQQR